MPNRLRLVFSAEGVVRYVARNSGFPLVSCRAGQPLSQLPSPADASGLSAHEDADPLDWLAQPARGALIVQTLSQRRGHAITLLAFDAAEPGEDEEAV